MKSRLGILYASWAEDSYQDVDVSSWVQSLQDRLLTLRECAHSIGRIAQCRGQLPLIEESLAECFMLVIRLFLGCQGCMRHLRHLGRGPTRLRRSYLRLIITSRTWMEGYPKLFILIIRKGTPPG